MFKKFINWLKQRDNRPGNSSGKLSKLLYNLSITEEGEIGCAEVHELIDQFSEMELRGEDAARLMPLVQKHLELCPDCGEEHEALLEALTFEENS